MFARSRDSVVSENSPVLNPSCARPAAMRRFTSHPCCDIARPAIFAGSRLNRLSSSTFDYRWIDDDPKIRAITWTGLATSSRQAFRNHLETPLAVIPPIRRSDGLTEPFSYWTSGFEEPAVIDRPSANMMFLPFTFGVPSRASHPSTIISVPGAKVSLFPPALIRALGTPVSTAQF